MIASRTGSFHRKTLETDIRVELTLDGEGRAEVDTGIPFLDHMLISLARHSGMNVLVQAKGDLHIDDHHTTEDVALVMGRAFRAAVGDRVGIARFGYAYAPMDDSLARAVIDICGRPYSVYKASGLESHVGKFQTYLVGHFFRSFAQEAGVTLHVELLYGHDPHQSIEAMFKALALAIRQAITIHGSDVPSTKGALD